MDGWRELRCDNNNNQSYLSRQAVVQDRETYIQVQAVNGQLAAKKTSRAVASLAANGNPLVHENNMYIVHALGHGSTGEEQFQTDWDIHHDHDNDGKQQGKKTNAFFNPQRSPSRQLFIFYFETLHRTEIAYRIRHFI